MYSQASPKLIRLTISRCCRLAGHPRMAMGLLLMALTLTGCSTPGMRSRQRHCAFASLTKCDQRLVLHGHVRNGLDKDAVYIAWGQPADVSSVERKTDPVESWVYISRWSAYAPMNGYGDSPYGYSLFTRPSYEHDAVLPYSNLGTHYLSGVHYKKAVFVNNRLATFSTGWRDD